MSEDGIRPQWASFRVRVATPELSGAFLTFASGRHTWGLADPVFVFGYRGDDSAPQHRRRFTMQTGASQYGDAVHTCQVEPRADQTYDIAVRFDWDRGFFWVFVDGRLCVRGVPLRVKSPIRFAAIYNWRSGARTAFSEMLLGDHCPSALRDGAMLPRPLSQLQHRPLAKRLLLEAAHCRRRQPVAASVLARGGSSSSPMPRWVLAALLVGVGAVVSRWAVLL